MIRIGLASATGSRHRLSGSYVLAVDMRNGSRLLVVSVIHAHVWLSVRTYRHPWRCYPHRAHRHFRRSLQIHTVTYVGASALMTLRIAAQHTVVLFRDLRKKRVVVGNQLANRGAPVEEEGIALLR